MVAVVSTESDAGFTPITASPHPKRSPSNAASRIPPISSTGRLQQERGPRVFAWRRRARVQIARQCRPIDRRISLHWPWPATRANRETQNARSSNYPRQICVRVESSINHKLEEVEEAEFREH